VLNNYSEYVPRTSIAITISAWYEEDKELSREQFASDAQ
jgi:hypothetical protein